MKIRALVVAVFVLSIGAASAHAAAVSQFIGVNAGLTLPSGDLSNVAGTGFFVGGTYTYRLNEQFGIGGDVNYNSFGKKTFSNEFASVDETFHMLQIGAHGKYYFPMKDSKMMPYGKVGLGIYNSSAKVETPAYTIGTFTFPGGSTTASSSDFGFSLGVGTTMKISDKATWGVEAMYHIVSTSGSSADMITIGASYNWKMGK